MLTRRFTRAAVLCAAGAYVVSVVPGVRPHHGFSTFWDVGVYVLVFLGAAAACVLRAVQFRADRIAWICIAAGLTSYAAGTLIFTQVLEKWASVPYPSVADGLWLFMYPMVLLGIGLMVRARMAGSSASMWLDGLVSGLGLASLSAAVIFPRVTQGAAGPTAAVVTNFAYPLVDLALVATVVGAMAALGAWRERTWLLLGAGFLAFTAADSWYLLQIAAGTYHPGSPVDASYLAAAALVALAAGAGPDERSAAVSSRPQTRSFLVPGAFALVAITVLAGAGWESTTALAVALAVCALTAAWTRTALAVREVVRLSDSRRQALTDALTGLPNRRAFYELLEAADTTGSDSSRDAARLASVILIDLDRFKEVNDALGHQLGDRLLSEVSGRFASLVPAGGTIARLGGDEFALFVPGLAPADAVGVSQHLLEALREPFVIDDMSLHVGASIGITGLEPGTEVGRALAEADLAMYRAKAGQSGWEVYDDERDGDAWDRLATVEALREALATGGLTVDFQPINALSPLRPAGMEALVRWNHPLRGRIAPDAFLPLAEQAGLMSQVTRTVLGLSLDEAQTLQRLGWTLPVSVNLSASDLLDGSLVDYVASALAERGLCGSALRIEITESLLVDTGGEAARFLSSLRELGIDLAVDDYGTGYSSLAYLNDLPVSYLKIDRGFTDRLLNDERTAVIVASTIEMAHRLHLKVVAEGVETVDQLEWLRAHACDLVQGYHTGRPVPADQLHAWLAERAATGQAPMVPAPSPIR